MPEDFNVALLDRAHEDGAVYGSKAVGEPPLMLAFAVREALRQAAARSGHRAPASSSRRRPRPEAVFWAIERGAARTAALRPVRLARDWLAGACRSCAPSAAPASW